jgi:predicted NUDIX family NTP pyrophosphohydrolase
MFRRRNNELEVLLVHPGGPFFVRKDHGVWTIPKGEDKPWRRFAILERGAAQCRVLSRSLPDHKLCRL